MGIMLLFGLLLLAATGILLGFSVAARRNAAARGVYLKIKNKIFWNAFIRYAFQSTLKVQVAAGAVILVALGLKAQG